MDSANTIPIKRKKFSLSLSKKTLFLLFLLTALNGAVLIVSVSVGEYPIPLVEVVQTIAGTGSADYDFIVNTLRLPRTLVAFLAGAGLAVSGLILQGLTRNSLASPSVLGLNAGASLAAVTVIVLLPAVSLFWLPFAAFSGAFLAGSFAYFLAWKQGSSPVRLILVGIGISSIAQALVTIVMTFGRIQLVGQAAIWMTGSVYGRGWEHFWPLFLWLGLLIPFTWLQARHLNIFQLGEDIAKGAGVKVEWQRGILLLTSVALAGVCVAAAGTINFVGLMAPHMARRLAGASHASLVPLSALIGGLLVMSADLIGRVILAPIEVPCGIITAVVGAPYLIYLLYKGDNK